jgi:hypothetical protein
MKIKVLVEGLTLYDNDKSKFVSPSVGEVLNIPYKQGLEYLSKNRIERIVISVPKKTKLKRTAKRKRTTK